MPLIKPDGTVVHNYNSGAPVVIPKPVTDGKRRLKDWLATFLDYTHDALSPNIFLKWTGLSTIAAAAQRKLYIENKHFMTYSNMYVLLVGSPGSGKSVAIRIGKEMLKKVPGIYLGSDAPSVVGIMDDFKDIPSQEHQSLSLFSLEFGSLYENAAETMTGFLTAFYDCDPDYRKRTRVASKETISKPWLNILAGTTTTWLGESLTKTAVEGGLVARTLYVHYGDMFFGSYARNPTAAERKMEADLVHDLAHISTLSGPFEFTPDGFAWFDKWQQNPERLPKLKDPRTTGYHARKPMHLLKVAMARSLSVKDELILTLEDLQYANAFLTQIEPGMKRALASVGGNTYATDIERIYAHIDSSEAGVGYPDLLAANIGFMDKRLFDNNLAALEAMGCVQKSLNGTRGLKFVALRPPV